MDDMKYIIGMIALWIIGALLSLSMTCGIIWFAIWTAKRFGMF